MATPVMSHQKWPLRLTSLRNRVRSRSICVAMANSSSDVRKEDTIIVGAGIAGLATAVALQRFEIKSPNWDIGIMHGSV